MTEMGSGTEKRRGQRPRQGLAPDQDPGLTREKDQWLSLTRGIGSRIELKTASRGDMI